MFTTLADDFTVKLRGLHLFVPTIIPTAEATENSMHFSQKLSLYHPMNGLQRNQESVLTVRIDNFLKFCNEVFTKLL